MPPAIAQVSEPSFDGAPSLLDIVADLKSSLGDFSGDAACHGRQMLEQLHRVASETEDKLTEQSHRIQFLECLSITDELTGLYNRRGYIEIINRTLALTRRYDEAGMLALLDLDGFKAINDSYGHAAGDAVLKCVSQILIENTRSTDYVCRVGGDEFAIVFVRADQFAIRKRVMLLRDRLNAAAINVGDVNVPVRVSIGLEAYGPNSSRDDLFMRADKRMYREKLRKKKTDRLLRD